MPAKNTGSRVAEDREDAQRGVGGLVPVVGSEHAERDAEDESDDEGVEDELDGRGAVVEQNARHGLAVADRGAEVALEQIADVFEVLDEERPVVAGGMDAFGQLALGQASTQRCGDRVTGDPHEEEDHSGEDEDGGNDQRTRARGYSGQVPRHFGADASSVRAWLRHRG